MGKGKGKGSAFEREICKRLSYWWTHGSNDDVFWRTAGSGAMAKVRKKVGKRTFGQYGDIQATNPIGQKLIDVCSIELKRGYNKDTFAHILDKPDNAKDQMYEKFMHQAEEDATNAGARSWMLIVKRDRRKPLVFIPAKFRKALCDRGSLINVSHPIFYFSVMNDKRQIFKIFGTTLDNFLKQVKPKHIKSLHDPEGKKLYRSFVTRKKIKIVNLKEDQIFKCTSCDEDEVVWNGKKWQCQECGVFNAYPI